MGRQGVRTGGASGDLVQVSRIEIEGDKIVFQINGGFNSGKPKWYQRVEVGAGGTAPPDFAGRFECAGRHLDGTALRQAVPPLKAAEVKKMLAPVLDFEKHSATETAYREPSAGDSRPP